MNITKIETNNDGAKIWALEMKDYEIDTDDGKLLVQGDVMVGVFTGKSDPFFKGALFSKNTDGYDLQGDSSLTEKEFKTNVKQGREVF